MPKLDDFRKCLSITRFGFEICYDKKTENYLKLKLLVLYIYIYSA